MEFQLAVGLNSEVIGMQGTEIIIATSKVKKANCSQNI